MIQGLQNKWLLTKNEKKEELLEVLLKILKEYKEKEVAINVKLLKLLKKKMIILE